MNILIDKELQLLREFSKEVEYFDKNYYKLYKAFKNQYVAVKNEKIYHNEDFDNLLLTLKNHNVDPTNTFIEFIKDQEIIYL